MPADDDVALPDLQIIQEFSLAVRRASAPREDVVRALEADLAWLSGGRRSGGRGPAKQTATKAPAKRPRRGA